MKRFFGMMPSSEIEKSKSYTDRYNTKVRIDAGKHGWTVTYCADGSTNYKDADDTAENNFNEAYKVADGTVGPLKEIIIHGDVCNEEM